MTTRHVVVIGGGLAGLAAAAYLTRGGARVTVLERAAALGGRAATHDEGGFKWNLGPHAFYPRGVGMEIMRELGVVVEGGRPAVGGALVVEGRTHRLPAGPGSLLVTGALDLKSKVELARWFGRIRDVDCEAIRGVTVEKWLAETFRAEDSRAYARALFRVSTYVDAPDLMSAGDAVEALQGALASVIYVDGGWARLVEQLRAKCDADVMTGARVTRIHPAQRVGSIEHAGVTSGTQRLKVERSDRERLNVERADGTVIEADAVVIAAGPGVARALLPESRTLARWADETIPVEAACLDVALRSLPRPKATFALGLDHPLYLSVHSAVARLAPDGGAVIHVAKYLGPGATRQPAEDRRALEELLDLVQPGWRDVTVASRYLPSMTVMHDLPRASVGGRLGRPGPAVPDAPGVFVAGDWVGPDGHLAHASLASARAAARAILAAASQAKAA